MAEEIQTMLQEGGVVELISLFKFHVFCMKFQTKQPIKIHRSLGTKIKHFSGTEIDLFERGLLLYVDEAVGLQQENLEEGCSSHCSCGRRFSI